MAKNWKPVEVAEAIKANDLEAILDFGRRFPLATIAIAQLNDSGVEVLKALPDYITMRKLEAGFKGEIEVSEAPDEEEEAPAEKPEKKARKAKAVEPEDEEEEEEEHAESAKDLYAKCKKLKLDVEPKQSVAYYKKAIAKAEAEAAKAKEKPAKKAAAKEEEDDWDL